MRSAKEMNGYGEIMSLVRMGSEPWGDAMGMLFALAEVTYVYTGEKLPEFEPSVLRTVGDPDTLERDDYPDGMVIDLYENGTITPEDVSRAYDVLSRYTALLKLAGRDY